MESPPFEELILALATAQQNQHQVLIALQKEQEQRFKALMLAQQEDRQAFRHQLASAGASTTSRGVGVAAGAPRFLPLLTGEAQLAAQQLPADSRLVYADLTKAILQRLSRSPEQHRQRFRTLALEEVGRSFAFSQQLLDVCRWWLRAENRDADEIIDLVALEQFVF